LGKLFHTRGLTLELAESTSTQPVPLNFLSETVRFLPACSQVKATPACEIHMFLTISATYGSLPYQTDPLSLFIACPLCFPYSEPSLGQL
jgi:hypothetical protein